MQMGASVCKIQNQQRQQATCGNPETKVGNHHAKVCHDTFDDKHWGVHQEMHVQCVAYIAFHHCSSSILLRDRFLVQWVFVSFGAIQTEFKAAAAASAKRRKQARTMSVSSTMDIVKASIFNY